MAVRPPVTASTKALRCLPSRPPQKFISIGQRCLSRSYICLKRRGINIPAKSVYNSQFVQTVFSAYGQHEAKLNDDEVSKNEILTDCGTDQECAAGGIVALGKFDALHIGHRELAIKASKIGSPFLLSFVGMEEVLGLPSRLPIVAKCDRKRVFSSWASLCGGVIPIEFQVEFPKVRHLTPRQFVEKLSKDLRVSGVVAGENYRFGYKASGDAKDLVRLCKEYNLEACIVSHVMDKTRLSSNGSLSNNLNSYDKGQVSSTRVREALALCDTEYVTQLLGRKHRLFLMVNEQCKIIGRRRFIIPKSCVLNQPPGNNVFDNCRVMIDDQLVGDCRVVIGSDVLDIELYSNTFREAIRVGQLISIEFDFTCRPGINSK